MERYAGLEVEAIQRWADDLPVGFMPSKENCARVGRRFRAPKGKKPHCFGKLKAGQPDPSRPSRPSRPRAHGHRTTPQERMGMEWYNLSPAQWGEQRRLQLEQAGFQPDEAKRFATAVHLYSGRWYHRVRQYWLKREDYTSEQMVDSFESRTFTNDTEAGGGAKFHAISEVAEAIEDYIDRSVELNGSFYPEVPLVRGIRADGRLGKTLMQMPIGGGMVLHTTTSTSTDKKAVDSFFAPDLLLEFRGGVKRSASVADLSKIPDEREVLIGRGSKFRLVDRYEDAGTPVLVFEEVRDDDA